MIGLLVNVHKKNVYKSAFEGSFDILNIEIDTFLIFLNLILI